MPPSHIEDITLVIIILNGAKIRRQKYFLVFHHDNRCSEGFLTAYQPNDNWGISRRVIPTMQHIFMSPSQLVICIKADQIHLLSFIRTDQIWIDDAILACMLFSAKTILFSMFLGNTVSTGHHFIVFFPHVLMHFIYCQSLIILIR